MKVLLDDIENNREKFLELRKTHIGASDVPTILGLNPRKSPFELWAEKTGGSPPQEDNDWLWYGRNAEELVAGMFLRKNRDKFIYPPNAVYQHRDHEWLTCSPDRFISDRFINDAFITCSESNAGLLECKTTIVRNDDWGPDKAPDYAHAQLITQMAVTGLNWGHCGVIIGGDASKSYFPRFEFDQALWDQMLPILANFNDCMRFRTPPQVRDGDLQAIANVYPSLNETELDLSEEEGLKDLLLSYEDIKFSYGVATNSTKELKAEIDKIYAQIRLKMASHKRATFGNYSFEAKTVSKKAYEVKASSYESFKIKKVGEKNGEE